MRDFEHRRFFIKKVHHAWISHGFHECVKVAANVAAVNVEMRLPN